MNATSYRQLQLNYTSGNIAANISNNNDGVVWVRAGGGAALHEEHLSQEVLWLGPAKVAAAQGVVRHRGNQVGQSLIKSE